MDAPKIDAPNPDMPPAGVAATEVPPADALAPTSVVPIAAVPPSAATPSEGVAAMWTAAGATAMGASHVRRQQPNQDAIAGSPPMPAAQAVLALSDGHGSAAHFRSEVGARLAVETAEAILAEAAADPAWIAARDVAQARALAGRIVATWREKVLAHLAAVPLAAEDTSRPDGDTRFLPYGATLVACAATPAGLFLMQLGDGDMLLGAADGAVVRPLPNDEGMVGEQTFSLCLPDAEQHIRLRIVTPDEYAADFVMLSTDGLSKSYADEPAFLRLAANWRQTVVDRGLTVVAHELDGWLSAASQQGSGDDITLGFIVRSAPAPGGAEVAAGSAPPPLPVGGRRGAPLQAIPLQAAPALAAADPPPAGQGQPAQPIPATERAASRPAQLPPRRLQVRTSTAHQGVKMAVAVVLLAAIAAACYYYYAKRVLPVAAAPASPSSTQLAPAAGAPQRR